MTNDGYKDIPLVCMDCGCDFLWTAGEQKFFDDKGFTQPKRCKGCREEKRKQKKV